MSAPVRGQFDRTRIAGWRRAVPVLSVMAGSLVTIWPFVATYPVLPQMGLLMLLGWRLSRFDVFPIWAGLPLGLFDDLLSGQPLGSAVLIWSTCLIGIDLVDQRTVFRDFWQDWLIATGAIAFAVIAGRLIAAPIGTHVDSVLLVQLVISVMLFPLATRWCAWLDRRRAAE